MNTRKAQKQQNKAYTHTYNDMGQGRTYDYYDDYDEENNYNQFPGGQLTPKGMPGQNPDYLDYKLPNKSEKKGGKKDGPPYPTQMMGSAYKEYNNDFDEDGYEYDYESYNNYSYPQKSKPIYPAPELLSDNKMKKPQMQMVGDTVYQALQNEKPGNSFASLKQKQQGLNNTKKDPIISFHQGKGKDEFDEPNFIGSSNFFSLEDGLNKMNLQDIPTGFRGDEGLFDGEIKDNQNKEGANNGKKTKKKKKKDKDSTNKVNEDINNKSSNKQKKKAKGAKKNEEISSELEVGESKEGNINYGQPQFYQPLQQQNPPYMMNPMIVNQHPQFRPPSMGYAPQYVQVPMNNSNFMPGMQPQLLGPRIVNPNLGHIPMHNQIHPQFGGMQPMPMMIDPRMIRVPPQQMQQIPHSPYNQNFIIQMNNYSNKQQIIPQDQGFGNLNNFPNMQQSNFPLPQQNSIEGNQDMKEHHSFPEYGMKPSMNQSIGQPLNFQMYPQQIGFSNLPQGINPMMINKMKPQPQIIAVPNPLNMGPRFPYNNQIIPMGNPNLQFSGQGIPGMELGMQQSNLGNNWIEQTTEGPGRDISEQNQHLFMNPSNQFSLKESKESKFSKEFDDYDFNKAFPVKDKMIPGMYGDDLNQNFHSQAKYNYMNPMASENVFKPQNDFENRIFDFNEFNQNDFGETHTESVKTQERLDITAKEFIPKSRLLN